MQVSLEWLNEYVDLDGIEPELIAHKLTMSGLEVEEVEHKKANFTNIITALIKKIDNHPNADKLHLVTLDTGCGEKTVVCGAQNIKEGQIIPYASVGSKVFSRKTGEIFELTPAVIRGVESQGMLCSEDELGLSGMQKEDGILILNNPDLALGEVKLGESLEKVLNLNDEIIFHLAPTANRGDQMSVIGVARELSALFNKKLKFSPLISTKDTKTDDFKVEIVDKETCKYYSIALLKDVKIKPAPEFIQRRVTAAGMRPINNVVDITNYVMLELGTPLHAFDFDKLNNYLCVRFAKDGETLVTIDEVERKLTKETVVIAKEDIPVCVGGVFGGLNSEIDDNTKNIALEAAFFPAHINRKSARSIGYRSEASARFERGVDIELVSMGLMMAVNLLIKYADAKFEGMAEDGSNKKDDIEITLRGSEIKRILGVEIEQDRCVEILQNLGFELLGRNEIAAKFKVPSYRYNDVTREIDLIEEVARIWGYDNMQPTLMSISEGASITEEQRILKAVNEMFLNLGFDEIITSSLVGNNLYREYMSELTDKALKVMNPQSEDATTLREQLMPNLLNVVKLNFDMANKNFRLYEVGKTFKIVKESTEDYSGVEEKRKLSGCIFGNINNALWGGQNASAPDFYTLKGVIENLFDILGLEKRVVYSPLKNPDEYKFMHPYQTATVEILGKNPLNIGYFGKLHPSLNDKMKLNQDLFVFELDLEAILDSINVSGPVKYKKLPQTFPVSRDIAFISDKETTNADILKCIKKFSDKNIYKGAKIFDIYEGKNIEEGKRSVAYRITLQDNDKTLTDEIIEKEISKIKEGLNKTFTGLSFRE